MSWAWMPKFDVDLLRLILSLAVERLVYSAARMKRKSITHARDTTETFRFKPSSMHRV